MFMSTESATDGGMWTRENRKRRSLFCEASFLNGIGLRLTTCLFLLVKIFAGRFLQFAVNVNFQPFANGLGSILTVEFSHFFPLNYLISLITVISVAGLTHLPAGSRIRWSRYASMALSNENPRSWGENFPYLEWSWSSRDSGRHVRSTGRAGWDGATKKKGLVWTSLTFFIDPVRRQNRQILRYQFISCYKNVTF